MAAYTGISAALEPVSNVVMPIDLKMLDDLLLVG